MAHELARMANGQTAMAFVGETPWHDLGQELTRDASIDTWRVQAGFDWQALSAPVSFQDQNGVARRYGDKQVIYRSDTGAALSVMGADYKIVQPVEVLEFFRDLTESGGWYLHTAGAMRDGRKLWAMATPRDDATNCIVKNDAVAPHLLLSTSLDGTTPTQAGLTAVRVVCANTLGLALGRGLTSADGTAAAKTRVSHRSIFDGSQVKQALGVAMDSWKLFTKQAQELATQPVNMEESREILRQLFGQPVQTRRVVEAPAVVTRVAEPVASDNPFAALLSRPAVIADVGTLDVRSDIARMLARGDAREQKSVARCMALFAGEGRGANAEGVFGTRWGLLNAVTEHIDHEQGRNDTRFEAAQFGRGAQFKEHAVRLIAGKV